LALALKGYFSGIPHQFSLIKDCSVQGISSLFDVTVCILFEKANLLLDCLNVVRAMFISRILAGSSLKILYLN